MRIRNVREKKVNKDWRLKVSITAFQKEEEEEERKP